TITHASILSLVNETPAPTRDMRFPYTTHFRSRRLPQAVSRGARAGGREDPGRPAPDPAARPGRRRDREADHDVALGERRDRGQRSEEHTSELQSLRHLVCRLLLEKKK